MTQDFSAPYDGTTKAVSAVVCVLLLVVAVMVHVIFVAAIVPLLLLAMFAYSARGYAVTEDVIVIRRWIGNIRIPLSAVREARPATTDDFRGSIRVWGSGGVFGYYGLFRTSRLGRCYWYLTDRQRSVVVRTAEKTYLVSPDNVAGFVAAVGAPAVLEARLPEGQLKSGSGFGWVLGMAIGGAVVALVALAFAYNPGPPGYTLTATRFTIHDRFYAVTLDTHAIDAAGVRVIDLASDPEWRPVRRTNGFANQHYQSGWFRLSNAKTVRLYRAGGTRLVLIPPKDPGGTFVLYQAADPDRFADELRRSLGAQSGSPAPAPAFG